MRCRRFASVVRRARWPTRLRRAAAVHDLDEPIWMGLQAKIAYLLLAPAFGVMLLTFVMLQIVPTFVKIFQDFGTELPAMTRALIGVSQFTGEFWFLLWPLFLLAPFLLFYLPMRYFGWIDWDLPGMGRFTRRLDSAEILDALALVAGSAAPVARRHRRPGPIVPQEAHPPAAAPGGGRHHARRRLV